MAIEWKQDGNWECARIGACELAVAPHKGEFYWDVVASSRFNGQFVTLHAGGFTPTVDEAKAAAVAAGPMLDSGFTALAAAMQPPAVTLHQAHADELLAKSEVRS